MQHNLRVTMIFVMLTAFFALPVFAASEKACRYYADRAIQQYQIMTTHSKCRINMDARWQPNHQNHYGWCLEAPTAWLRSEEKARDDHLYRCGGQIRFD
jgi:hypothetical protein